MLRKSLFLLAGLMMFAGTAHATNTALFKTEAEAAQSCTGDTVVWIKLDAHLYYHKEQTGYGGTDGLYGCEKGARKSGYFAAR